MALMIEGAKDQKQLYSDPPDYSISHRSRFGCEAALYRKRTQDTAQKEQNPLVSQGVLMVEPDGIEPTTSTMPLGCGKTKV